MDWDITSMSPTFAIINPIIDSLHNDNSSASPSSSSSEFNIISNDLLSIWSNNITQEQQEDGSLFSSFNLLYSNDTSIFSNNLTNKYNNSTIFPCSTNQKSISNVISMILYAIVCIVGLFGNTLVIYVVLRFSKMQTVTNMYILNLAIADECYLIGIPFLLITIHLGHWTFGSTMCKAYMVSTSITQFTSSIFLCIMSADRYIAVCHPISSPRFRTPLVSKIVSGIAWIMSAIIMLPVILFANTIEHDKGYSCIIKWPENHGTESGTTFTLYALVLGFAIPLSFISIFYYLVIRKLHTVGPKNKSKEKKRSHRKVTKLVLTVVTVYVLCWLPHWISQVALIHSPPQNCRSKLEITIFLLVGCLGYSNSAMNPILYAFLSDNFKKSFMKACTCAAGKDINAQLQLEHSLFPRFGRNRGSERLLSTASKKVLENNRIQNQKNGSNNLQRNSMVEQTIGIDPTTTMTLPGKSTATIATNLSVVAKNEYNDNDADKIQPPVLHTDL